MYPSDVTAIEEKESREKVLAIFPEAIVGILLYYGARYIYIAASAAPDAPKLGYYGTEQAAWVHAANRLANPAYRRSVDPRRN